MQWKTKHYLEYKVQFAPFRQKNYISRYFLWNKEVKWSLFLVEKNCSVNRRWFITRIIRSYWRDFSLQCTVKGTDYFSFLDNCHRFWMFPDVNGLFCFLQDVFFLQQKGKVRVISISLPTFNWTTWQIYDVFIYYICSWFRHLSSIIM